MLPEHLLTLSEKEALRDCVPERFSCHAFRPALTPALYASLTYLCGRFRGDQVRFVPLPVPDGFFSTGFLGLNRVQGCPVVIAALVRDQGPASLTEAGFLGEALVLSLTRLPLGTCYLTGGYRREILPLKTRAGETLSFLIAAGEAAESPGPRRKKSMSRLCRGDPAAWPEEAGLAATLVQSAPSSQNQQPWEIAFEGRSLVLSVPDFRHLELGIAMLHAELALTVPHHWACSVQRRVCVARGILDD